MHWYFIEVKHEDVTPDGKITFKHFLVVSARVAVFFALLNYYHLGFEFSEYGFLIQFKPYFAQVAYFSFGALAIHLLLFGPLLNRMRGLRWYKLGKGFFDKYILLGKMSDQYATFRLVRIAYLLVIISGMVAGYYQWY